MTKGYLPYRDFFDMKGPWLFFFEYISQLIYYGRTGVFLLQCVNLGIVLFFCQKIYTRYFGGRRIVGSLCMLLPLYVIISSTMEGGNLTEEWSLSFIFISLYFSLEFIMGEETEHKPKYALIYGICFGILALIRIINAVMIGAIVMTITVYLVKEHKWKNLLINALAFLFGVFVSFIPPLLYFGHFGEIINMLYCTFVFGYIYGTEGFGIGTGGLFLLSLLWSVIVLLIIKNRNIKMQLLIILNTVGMSITLGMGNSSLHDYVLIVPGVMLGEWVLVEKWRKNEIGIKREVLVTVLSVICFAYPCYKMAGAGIDIVRQSRDTTLYDHVVETGECIPEEEKKSVWGYEVPLRWYTITDIVPYNKYCGWQEHYMRLSPEIEKEIKIMLEETPPKWIVTKTSAIIENKIVITQLKNNYHIFKENEDCRLYRRNN